MEFLLDGKSYPSIVQNDVRINKEIIDNSEGRELKRFMTIILNHEGMVIDIYNEEGENIKTVCQTYEEIADTMI